MKRKITQDRELFDATPFEVGGGVVKNLIPPHVPKRTVISQLEKQRNKKKRNYRRGVLLRKAKRQGINYDIKNMVILKSPNIDNNETVKELRDKYGFIIAVNHEGAYNLGFKEQT